jgi:selenocysteine-specific elongation factor
VHVICTAGHVDHGKSTLVRALTGMEPDRFAEEQQRGLTIDLGFAWSELADGVTVAFVDLPGHERFIANMLSGAGAVDLALFVVAADEGWMPQSREHLDILDLLGVRHGVVALTKSDTVDADTRDLGMELVREELAGSGLAGAAIVPVSGVEQTGLAELRDALAATIARAPGPRDRGRPRLWIDRSFTVRGAGTVVTGTLSGGTVSVGDELAVLPGGAHGRVRGLQSLQETITSAPPGSRVAVNLSGVDRVSAARGDAVVRAGQWLSVTGFDAWIRVLPGQELDRKGAWHLHVGSGHRLATVFPTSGRAITTTGYLRIELDRPVTVCAGDRFVLREAGRRATVGGGVVLDADPLPRPRGPEARGARQAALAARREALDAGPDAQDTDPGLLLVLHAAERGAADLACAAAAVGLDVTGATAAAVRHGLLPLGGAIAHPDAVDRWAGALRGALERYHRAHPLDRAAPRDVAVRALGEAGCAEDLAPALLEHLAGTESIALEGPGVRLRGHTVELDPGQAAARDALLEALGAQPFSPPRLSEVAAAAGASAPLVRELEAAGQIVRLDTDLALLASAVEAAAGQLKAAFDAEGPLTAARAKDVLGTSRKYALPLLEHLDRIGRTRRVGDTRVVR